MKKGLKYDPEDRMCDLVENDNRVLFVMSRFGIRLGVGDKTVGEVCRQAGVDLGTFLAVLNTVLDEERSPGYDVSKVSIPALIDGLRRAHGYYLDFCFPEIRRKLVEAWGDSENDLLSVMLRYYDDFVDELRKHTESEEKMYALYYSGRPSDAVSLKNGVRTELLAHKHEPMKEWLGELRRLLIKYYPARDINRMNEVLFDLQACEHAMVLHCKVEELLLFAILAGSEKNVKNSKSAKITKAKKTK